MNFAFAEPADGAIFLGNWTRNSLPTEEFAQQKQKMLRRGGKSTQKNYTKKILMTQITTMVCSLT